MSQLSVSQQSWTSRVHDKDVKKLTVEQKPGHVSGTKGFFNVIIIIIIIIIAANQAAANKIAKYDELASTHIFYPVAIERGGVGIIGLLSLSRNWQTGHINHWRSQRIHLSVSAVVNSPPKGKCGRLPQHL